MEQGTEAQGVERRRAWVRALALFAVAIATVVARPSVLVAVPLLVLIGMGGIRSVPVFVMTVLGMAIVMLGPRDDLWYLERAWALVAGGIFAALAVGLPHWRLSSRSLAAVGATVGVFGVFLAARAGAWTGVDWSVAGGIEAAYQNVIDLMVVTRGGQALDPASMASMMWLTESTIHVFPARLGLQTMAALGVAWWLYVRLMHNHSSGLGRLRDFRFNDHLVWLMIIGLGMVALRSGEGAGRIGANLAVFMGGLYAMRGAGVFLFVNGGISFIGVVLLAVALFFLAPLVLGFALMLGVADTWLDVRTRMSAVAG